MSKKRAFVPFIVLGLVAAGHVQGYSQQGQYQHQQAPQQRQQQHQEQYREPYQGGEYYAPPPSYYPTYPGYLPPGPVDPDEDETNAIYRENQHRPRE